MKLLRRPVSGLALLLAFMTTAMTGCGSILDVPLPGGADVGSDPLKVHLQFRDVLDLVPQSTVKVNEVTVGRVSAIKLKGYVADVTVLLPKNVDLPDNAVAEIRQTSLLGEKFVSLKSPESPSVDRLGNGDVIPLSRTGRNPEVEEVLGALALLLNGGGVGQLKTITEELNTAVGGRESEVRSVITQIRTFMGQLDANKADIVSAIENLNRLALQLRNQDPSIKAALNDLPGALKSVNNQRDDLVKMLRALSNLSSVGVKVISASKESTINSLQSLAPVLAAFAKSGENFPKSFQVFLTYPFVDEAVGRDPQVARNLHMGDYTNLAVRLDLDLKNGLPGLPGAPTLPPLPTIEDLINLCKTTPLASVCQTLDDAAVQQLCAALPSSPLCPAAPGGGGTTLPLPTLGPLGGILGGLGRATPGRAYQAPVPLDPFGLARAGYDSGLGTLLLQGVAANS